MGNNIAIEQNPCDLKVLIDSIQVRKVPRVNESSSIDKLSYQHLVLVWEIYPDKKTGFPTIQPVQIQSLEKLNSHHCYILLHLYKNQSTLQNPSKDSKFDLQVISPEGQNNLFEKLKQCEEKFSPRGFSNVFGYSQFKSSKKTDSSLILYRLYLWNGKDCGNLTKAISFSKSSELDNSLSQAKNSLIQKFFLSEGKLLIPIIQIPKSFSSNLFLWTLVGTQKTSQPSNQQFRSINAHRAHNVKHLLSETIDGNTSEPLYIGTILCQKTFQHNLNLALASSTLNDVTNERIAQTNTEKKAQRAQSAKFGQITKSPSASTGVKVSLRKHTHKEKHDSIDEAQEDHLTSPVDEQSTKEQQPQQVVESTKQTVPPLKPKGKALVPSLKPSEQSIPAVMSDPPKPTSTTSPKVSPLTIPLQSELTEKKPSIPKIGLKLGQTSQPPPPPPTESSESSSDEENENEKDLESDSDSDSDSSEESDVASDSDSSSDSDSDSDSESEKESKGPKKPIPKMKVPIKVPLGKTKLSIPSLSKPNPEEQPKTNTLVKSTSISGPIAKHFGLDLKNIEEKGNTSSADVLKPLPDRLRENDVICSKVFDNLFQSSETIAKNKEQLVKHGITHILNAGAVVCPNYFPNDFEYNPIYLFDGNREDISCLLLKMLEWIDNTLNNGGKLLIHCQQGVSRSSSMTICYLMWKKKLSFGVAHQFLKDIRSTANPNAGFIAQLMVWEKRLHKDYPPEQPRLLRITPHCAQRPDLLVARQINKIQLSSLDKRFSFIFQTKDAIRVWIGKECHQILSDEARHWVKRIQKYETAPSKIEVSEQGRESPDFWTAFSEACPAHSKTSGENLEQLSSTIDINDSYNDDYQLLLKITSKESTQHDDS